MNILSKILITGTVSMMLSSSLYGLDVSTNSSSDINVKEDETQSKNRSKNNSTTNENGNTKTETWDKSRTDSTDLKRIEQTDALMNLMALERAGIQPFKGCSVLTKPRLRDDFGLSCITRFGGSLDSYCTQLDNAGKSNVPVEDYIDDIDYLKEYMSCIGLYGTIIAQDMKRNKFSPKLTDKDLKYKFMRFASELEDSECRFDGTIESVICGSIAFKISSNPAVFYGSISMYSEQSYLGYTSAYSENVAKRYSASLSKSRSKRRSDAISLSDSITNNTTTAASVSASSAANLSMSKLLPND